MKIYTKKKLNKKYVRSLKGGSESSLNIKIKLFLNGAIHEKHKISFYCFFQMFY